MYTQLDCVHPDGRPTIDEYVRVSIVDRKLAVSTALSVDTNQKKMEGLTKDLYTSISAFLTKAGFNMATGLAVEPGQANNFAVTKTGQTRLQFDDAPEEVELDEETNLNIELSEREEIE